MARNPLLTINDFLTEFSQFNSTGPENKIPFLCDLCRRLTTAALVEFQYPDENGEVVSITSKDEAFPFYSKILWKPADQFQRKPLNQNPVLVINLKDSVDDPKIEPLLNAGINNLISYTLKISDETEGILNSYYDDSDHDFDGVLQIIRLAGNLLVLHVQNEGLRIEKDLLIRKSIEKDRFISLLAHDLKSPVNGFIGLTHLLTDMMDNLSADDASEIISTLRKSADNMAVLLENFLEYSRFLRNVLKFEPRELDLKTLLKQAIQNFSDQAVSKQIEIHNKVVEDIVLFADQHMTTFIIRNLMLNGIKYSRKGGDIIIKASYDNGPQALITFEDHGMGISGEIMKRLFNIDELIKKQGTDGEYGSGLGLILCKIFIEKHDGTLKIESNLNPGTAVTFTLPVANPKPSA